MADPGLLSIELRWLEQHGQAYQIPSGQLCLELPEPLVPLDEDLWPETAVHVCQAGETLFSLAQLYYADLGLMSWPVGLWEVIYYAQPDSLPIRDPFAVLKAGQIVMIPPPDYIMEVAIGDSLRESPLL